MSKLYDGQLEIDTKRGVIYFHSTQTGTTILRISRLPAPIPTKGLLDITHGYGVSWVTDQEEQTR